MIDSCGTVHWPDKQEINLPHTLLAELVSFHGSVDITRIHASDFDSPDNISN